MLKPRVYPTKASTGLLLTNGCIVQNVNEKKYTILHPKNKIPPSTWSPSCNNRSYQEAPKNMPYNMGRLVGCNIAILTWVTYVTFRTIHAHKRVQAGIFWISLIWYKYIHRKTFKNADTHSQQTWEYSPPLFWINALSNAYSFHYITKGIFG